MLEQRIKEEASKIVEKKKVIEIAKNLKRKGVGTATIASATGLTTEEVEKLRVRKG